ncbi:hypothetical protein, partial [Priestia megaterium]|uniref:hypothetical protein n=5 Tax=Bacillaceae TaxID=186817 RepID=UPI001C9A20E9
APVGPVGPVTPVAPVGPVGPVAPVTPVGPVGPVTPVIPVGQQFPRGPQKLRLFVKYAPPYLLLMKSPSHFLLGYSDSYLWETFFVKMGILLTK